MAAIAIVIPAYKPSAALIDVVSALATASSHAIVVVDDGSGPAYREIFARAAELPGVRVLRHAVNLGKGAALKTAMNHVLCALPETIGIVTADADGQHHPDDILRTAEALIANPSALVLGCRGFDRDVPLRSRFGNVLTRGVMHALLGRKLTDTQTGLRGIPAAFLPKLLRLETTGYEFELQMLIAAHELSIPFLEVPIRTIYEAGNASSHFNPIVDSMKIYFVLLRFGSVSMLTALIDNLVFYLAWRRSGNVIAAQVLGRAIAVCFNYWMVRSSVFYSRQRHQSTLPKYLLLVVASGTASYGGIEFLNHRLGMHPVTAKLMVETVLFFVNFAVQRLFIFNQPTDETGAGRRTTPALAFALVVAGVFAGLLALEVHGIWNGGLFRQHIWDPDGLKRFTRYIGVFVAFAAPVLMMFPWAFAGAVAALLLVASVLSVGLQPVLATGFFFLSACALGCRLLGVARRDSLPVDLCATLAGAAVYVVLMTLTARLPIHYPLVWAAVLSLPVALDLRGVGRRLRYWASLLRAAELRCPWERGALALLFFFAIAHWFVALEPEKSADGLAMHLAIPLDIARHHAMTFDPARFVWSVMPMGADWAYSIVCLLGGEFAARLLNYGMLLMVLALLYSGARRFVSRATAYLLAATFAATPLVQLVTGSLFVENFMAALVLGIVTVTCLFGESGEKRYLFAAMLLGGAAITTKLGAVAFVALALPFLAVELRARWKSLGPRRAVVCLLALLLLLATALPTFAIAYARTGNPIYPFNNQKLHSPLLDPTVNFNDLQYHVPLDWNVLPHLTFRTSDVYEGQNGSLGFQYLIAVPMALLGLLVVNRRLTRMAAVMGLGAGVLILYFQPNVRYLYATLPLVTMAFAGLLGWLFANERRLYRVLVGYLVAVTALNAYFLPSASYYHKDFSPRQPFSRAGKDRYLAEAVPIRKVIEYYNRNHDGLAVLMTGDSSIAGIEGEVYENHWHTYAVWAAIHRAADVPALLRLMRQWNVGYFISQKPAYAQKPVDPPALKMLLASCTVPVYEFGDYYLSRLERACRPQEDKPTLVAMPGFKDDLDPAIVFRGAWTHDSSFALASQHTVSYSDAPGAEILLSFEGRGVSYIYTRAPNRGVAAVTVDGVDQSTLDLFSPTIEWQSARRFCCFPPGRHVIAIRVTGRHDPQSTGAFVDLDTFLIE